MIAIPYPLFDRVLTPAERRQMAADAKRHANLRRGHADYPGTGPEGETCGSCTHLARKQMAKTYLTSNSKPWRWLWRGALSNLCLKDPSPMTDPTEYERLVELAARTCGMSARSICRVLDAIGLTPESCIVPGELTDGWRRDPRWHHGRRNGIKWAIEWLHARAGEMNDPNAKAVLNTAAFQMGNAAKQPSPPSQESSS